MRLSHKPDISWTLSLSKRVHYW